MIFSAVRAAAVACLVIAQFAAAQTPQESFEDLSQRAQAALDSHPDEAAALYKKALELQPVWPEGWFYMGGALYRLNRYNEAIEAFNKGIEQLPGNGVAWAFLGLCEYELGHYEKALSEIAKGEQMGLGSNVGFESAVRQRAAMILIRSSLFDQAMSQLQPLAKYEQNLPPVVEAVGLCSLAVTDDPSKLSEAKRKIVMMAGAAMWAATCQRPKEAEEGFRQLLATYPKEPGVHYAHGLYLMDMDQHGALEEFQNELKVDPNHWPALLVGAFLNTREGAPDLAMQLAEQARKVAPSNYVWLCDAEMGRALLAKDDPEKAIPLFEDSVKRQPDNAQTHYYLEQAYRRAGRKADAQREKAEFVRLKSQQDPLAVPGLVNSTSR